MPVPGDVSLSCCSHQIDRVHSSPVSSHASGGIRSAVCSAAPVRRYDEVGNSSWGGSIVEYEGTWHMIAARMVGHCGLGAWEQNSEIVRATAADPEGLSLSPRAAAHAATAAAAAVCLWLFGHDCVG